jgi:hypothetical protein
MFTASGLLVRFLKVFEKSGYQSVKWVRYLTKANGSYQIRVSGVAAYSDLCFRRSGARVATDASSELVYFVSTNLDDHDMHSFVWLLIGNVTER